jgi:hypothetical protein
LTLTRLLEIKLRLLKYEDHRGLTFAERLWRERGSPTAPAELSEVLETILEACQREGLSYPPILLRRRKELQRGVWKPSLRVSAAPTSPPPRSLPGQASLLALPPGEPLTPVDCQLCGNKGFVVDAERQTARSCSCWQQRLTRKLPRESEQQGCYTPGSS